MITSYHLSIAFFNNIIGMYEIPLNKFEKEKRVEELHVEGKTIRAIAPIVHMSFRDISKIIKSYDKRTKLQQNKKEENNQSTKIKKPSKRSQAYELFLNGKTPVQVAIDLNLDFQKARNYWTEFLRLQNMKKLYNIFIEYEFHLEYLFKIDSFLLRNEIPIKDIENILQTAYEIIKLYQTHSNLKAEIEKLEQIKKEYSFQLLPPIQPLPFNKPNYNYYSY